MKKIVVFSLLLVLISAAASAQAGPGIRHRKQGMQRGFNQGQLTRPERFELRKDVRRSQILVHRSRRDGIVTPVERLRIHHSKCDTRRDAFRFKHNGRRRLI
ncbi:MAG TPA: hypothetical protein VN451_00385 [Chitinophagaceae bacterium]|nr:hypothetical protein [Chitinophagaceae bacterium]